MNPNKLVSFAIILLTLLTGCRAYLGYYDSENDDSCKGIKNEEIISTSYDILFSKQDKLCVYEINNIKFKEYRAIEDNRIWLYSDNMYKEFLLKKPNIFSVPLAVLAFPLDVAIYPFRMMYAFFAPSETLNSKDIYGDFYASRGRRFWTYINPLYSYFQIAGGGDGTECERLKSEPYIKDKVKTSTKIIHDRININVKTITKKFCIQNGTTLREIAEKLLDESERGE